ncbi:hypothetical protein HELRODRAFT_181952 [Helobdella robusta]|uniref:Uncharacterized protein n=1 Tax=Helobdella robusta TaxID=6412 RepID=T1FHI1_HELRO|nr:hypothetical protein HELRODRAFT_181952 [Helobdella robusta]ESN91896.1 hypothetical protein HELRODRAFT_181952 [Helobdella robusta]
MTAKHHQPAAPSSRRLTVSEWNVWVGTKNEQNKRRSNLFNDNNNTSDQPSLFFIFCIIIISFLLTARSYVLSFSFSISESMNATEDGEDGSSSSSSLSSNAWLEGCACVKKTLPNQNEYPFQQHHHHCYNSSGDETANVQRPTANHLTINYHVAQAYAVKMRAVH